MKRGDEQDGAAVNSGKAAVDDPQPDPGYPRYRVEPGERPSLAGIDPAPTEHYRKKKEVLKELEAQRRRIRDLPERLHAENRQGLLVMLQAMDTGARTGPSSTSSAG